MKKLLLSAIAVFAFATANAQDGTATETGFSKGNVFLSGTVGFSSSKQGDDSTNGFTLAPKAGYFVTNNIALGLGVDLTTSKNDDGVNTINKQNNFGGQVFGRYYFTPASQFSLFGQLGVGFGSQKHTTEVTVGNTTTTTETKYNNFGVAVAPGVNYFISKHFSLEASWGVLGYNSNKQDVAGAKAQNDFAFGLNLSNINFGLNYKF